MTKMTETAALRGHRGRHPGAAPADRAHRSRAAWPRWPSGPSSATWPTWPTCSPPRSTNGPNAAVTGGSHEARFPRMKRLADFDVAATPA